MAIEIMSKPKSSSRKRSAEEAELEIDVSAPEPPSKKALRKAKKRGIKTVEAANDRKGKTEEPDLKRLEAADKDRSEYGVWIGNLAFTTTKKDLYGFLINNGIPDESITRLHLPPGNDARNQNRGFAYADFSTQKLVEETVELSETLLGGRRLLIKDAKNFQGRPDKPKEQNAVTAKAASRKIFVGNLDFHTTVQDLEKHFGVCGPITKTHMASFQDSGKCKGYVWIEFESLSSAEAAMRGWVEIDRPVRGKGGGQEMKKKKIWLSRMDDRKLRIEYAEDATTRYKKRFAVDADGEVVGLDNASDGEASGSRVKTRKLRTGKSEKSSNGRGHEIDSTKMRNSPAGQVQQEGARIESDEFGKARISSSRYDDKTVQKLAGAIVKGKGSKVVFE